MPTLVPLAQASLASHGGKAAGLRRLLQAGLPVPPGFCLPFELYRRALPAELPEPATELGEAFARAARLRDHLRAWTPEPGLRRTLQRSWQRLGAGQLVVRSSASCEDLAGPSAGLFVSCLGIEDLPGLLEGIRRCWISLWELPALAGLRLSGRWPGDQAMGVIVQAQVRAGWAGLLLSRDPGQSGQMRIEAVRRGAERLAAGELDPEVVLVARRGRPLPASSQLPLELLGFLRESALRLEALLGSTVELEWLHDGSRPFLLQVRPSRMAASPPRRFPIVWSDPALSRRSWRWDREHNPDPLSPAHQSLVELLEARRPGPAQLMVQNGYLFSAVEAAPPARPTSGPSLGELWEQLGGELERALSREEARKEAGEDELAVLQRALDFFVRFQADYAGPLAEARYRARQELRDFLGPDADAETGLLAGDNSTLQRTGELWRLARQLRGQTALILALRGGGSPLQLPALREPMRQHLARHGALARRWDLAAPTLAEQPQQIAPRLLSLLELEEDPLRAAARAEQAARRLAEPIASRLGPHQRARFAVLLEAARLARRLEEDDDLLFARALALVRAALLRAADRLQRQGYLEEAEEIFLLRLEEVAALLQEGSARQDWRAELQRRRRTLEENRALLPPLGIQGEQLVWPTPSGETILRGAGVGGLARGPVRLARRLEDLLALPAGGAVVVCPSLLPSLAVVLAEAAALVTDHGGLLSHAASLARELGVPAVVGTGSATRELREGELVWVDGGRGLVLRES